MKFLITLLCSFFLISSANAEPLPGDSIYQIRDNWHDQSGKTVYLEQFRGQPIILAMIYTNCPGACPMTVQKIEGLREKLTEKERSTSKVLLLSLDSERDKPEILAAWAKKMKLNQDFIPLGSRAETVQLIAAALGIQYKRLKDGSLTHSSPVFILDKNGVAQFKREGSGFEVEFTEAFRRVSH